MRPHLPQHHVLQHGQVREEVEGLEDEAEPAPDRHRLDRGVGDHLAVEEDVAVVDLLQQVDAAQQGRLARPRGADQRDRLVLADGRGRRRAAPRASPNALVTPRTSSTGAPALIERLRSAPPMRSTTPGQRHRDRQVEQRRGDQRRVVEGLALDDLGDPERLLGTEDRDQDDVLLQGEEVVEERRRDPAHRLRQDHVAQRLRLGQPDRQRRVALAAVDRADPGAVDLGDVGAVGEAEGDPAEDDGVGREAGQPQGRDPEPDQVDEQEGRDAAEEVDVDRRQQPDREQRRRRRWSGSGRSRGRRSRTAISTITKIFTSSQKPLRTSGKESLKTDQEKKRFPHHRPAGAGQDPDREAADDDDAGDGGDRLAPSLPAAFGRLPREAAVADDGGPGQPAPL